MRPILALAIILLCLDAAGPEPAFNLLFAEYFRGIETNPAPALMVEASTGRSDRLVVAALESKESTDAASVRASTAAAPEAATIVQPDAAATPVLPEAAATTAQPDTPAQADTPAAANESDPAAPAEPRLRSVAFAADADDDDSGHDEPVAMDELCDALLSSAQDNHLPAPFLANLIWQESRLRDDAVSPAGALGIAQFMPRVAQEKGLQDPFDPLEAIPASARLLSDLRKEFGNLGMVAAAYNAGPHRVSQWLGHHRKLPKETRNYVMRVTGRTADQWRKTPLSSNALRFSRMLPCRLLPEFADVEQAQAEQAASEPASNDKPTETAGSPRRQVWMHKNKHLHVRLRSQAARNARRRLAEAN